MGPPLRKIVKLTVNVLDIQVDALVLALLLHPRGLMVPPQLLIPLAPLLSPTDKQLLSLEIRIVQLVDGSSGIFVFLVVDESESLVLARFVELESARDDGSEGLEETVEFVLSGGYQKLTKIWAKQSVNPVPHSALRLTLSQNSPSSTFLT